MPTLSTLSRLVGGNVGPGVFPGLLLGCCGPHWVLSHSPINKTVHTAAATTATNARLIRRFLPATF